MRKKGKKSTRQGLTDSSTMYLYFTMQVKYQDETPLNNKHTQKQ